MKTAIFSVSLSEYQTVNPISTKDGRIAWTHEKKKRFEIKRIPKTLVLIFVRFSTLVIIV